MNHSRSILAALVLTAACADQSTEVNVAPSAQGGMEQVVAAVDYLNASLGAEVYTVTAVDHEHRVDGEIIVRAYDRPLDRDGRRAESQQTTKGVIVRLVHGFTSLAVAHELCHAAGLGHLDREDNLMHPNATQWVLTDAQLDALAVR